MLVHQALHGYKNGHQLLAISVELSREQLAQLRVITDLSGPAFRAGFDGYLTGIPLVGGKYFALARTWFASEMPRPGCVWTHTLLLSAELLRSCSDLHRIATKFRRPPEVDYGAYEVGLPWLEGSKDDSGDERSHVSARVGAQILDTLYGSEAATIVIADDCHERERTVVAIWSQQWPELRKEFRFCTGSLSPRDQPFDLLVAPPESGRALRGDARAQVIWSFDGPQAFDEWVALATTDLLDGGGDLREFLWEFGPELGPTRPEFGLLCWLYAERRRWQNHPELLQVALVRIAGSAARNAPRLLAELFGASSGSGGTERLAAIAEAFICSSKASEISADAVCLEKHGSRLVGQGLLEALRLADLAIPVASHNEHAKRYLRGLGDGLLGLPEWIADQLNPALLVELACLAPELTLHSQFWKLGQKGQVRIAEAVSEEWTGNHLSDFLQALVDAHAWAAVGVAIRRLSGPAVLALIDIEMRTSAPTSRAAIQALEALSGTILVELGKGTVHGERLWAAAALVNPNDKSARDIGGAAFLSLDSRKAPTESYRHQMAAATLFVFAVSEVGPPDLLRLCFTALYRAAERNELCEDAWNRLLHSLRGEAAPWDKCARLIETAVATIKYRLAVSLFPMVFNEADIYSRAVAVADDSRSGRHLLRELRNAAREGAITLTDAQLAALGEDNYWWWD